MHWYGQAEHGGRGGLWFSHYQSGVQVIEGQLIPSSKGLRTGRAAKGLFLGIWQLMSTISSFN